jgi:lysyl-tRNA synthetase class 2
MFKNELTIQRIEKANKLRELGINPYSHSIKIDSTAKEIIEKYSYLQESEKDLENEYSLSGRVMLNRNMGNLVFITMQDHTERIQLFIGKNNLINPEEFKIASKLIDIGDIVCVKGNAMRTQKGELSIFVKEFSLITKALSPLPEKFHGLSDQETKYRKRYLDMIMNPEVKDVFVIRSKIISEMRRNLEDNNFIEVETPVLNNIPGGANAKPFITHHNALGQDRYLRIAPELYLKRCIVGGIPRVFEIGKNFRNEGIDATHNPEFTSIEFYWSYQDYEGLMNYIELLLQSLTMKTNDSLQVPYGENIIDFNNFQKISFKNALIDIGNVPESILSSTTEIENFLKNKNIKVKQNLSLGKLWEELFDEFVEENLINPTFIIDYPTDISPLARKKDSDPTITERFELFIAGREIANGFNELNDPIDQYERFLGQVASKDSDDEAMHMDKDFIESLMQGMPPVAGAGIGIDRLVMLLTNQHTIKDVIIFPALRNQI